MINTRTLATLLAFLIVAAGRVTFATPAALPEMTAEEKKLAALVDRLCEKDDGEGLLLALDAAEKMRGSHCGKIADKIRCKLGELKYAQAVEPLRKAGERGDISALTALAQIGGPEAVETLLRVASDVRGSQDIDSRHHAIALLGGVDDPRVVPTLLTVLSDAEGVMELRHAALRTLMNKELNESLVRRMLSVTSNLDDSFAGPVIRTLGSQRNPAVVTPLIETLTALLDRIDKPLPADDEEAATKEKRAKEKARELFKVGLPALESVAREMAKGTEYSVILRSEISVLKGKEVRFGYKRTDVDESQIERRRVLTLWAEWWKENKPALAPGGEEVGG